MGFTYVISDVHGHLDCFEAILEKINLQPDDRLYSSATSSTEDSAE